jgi:hypothetical protein
MNVEIRCESASLKSDKRNYDCLAHLRLAALDHIHPKALMRERLPYDSTMRSAVRNGNIHLASLGCSDIDIARHSPDAFPVREHRYFQGPDAQSQAQSANGNQHNGSQ